MHKAKANRLQNHGWAVGDTADFLNLTAEEAEFVELKAALAAYLLKKRRSCRMTQVRLARLIGSSQSRVAKMEKNDSTVSVDLLVRSLCALGTSKREIAHAIG